MAATATSIEEAPARPSPTLGRVRALVAMTRPSHLLLIGVIFANGVLLAVWRGGAVTDAVPLALLLALVASAAIHLANEAADDATDRLTTRTAFSGGSGALAASGLTPRVPLLASLLLAATATVGTVAATAAGPLPMAAAMLLLAGLLGGLAYSLPPLAVMRHGWGEPLNAVLGALLLPLAAVATVASTVGAIDIMAFLPFFFVTFASVLATAWPDREADRATGKRTLQVRLRPATLRRIALLTAIAFVVSTWLAFAAGAMPLAPLGLLVVPLLALGRRRYTRSEDPSANVAAMIGLATITFLVLAGSVALGGGPA
jgi:1,4-dihydroxy-2-naphthoate octaprenyltransferase